MTTGNDDSALQQILLDPERINEGFKELLNQYGRRLYWHIRLIAFNLRYYDELSYEEISRITSKSVSSLKTNYHYATQRVKDYIKQHSI